MTKKNELVEIKKNTVGTGLLIENDGYIRLPKSSLKENFTDGEWHVPYPFIVDAVFQKYGIKNANGRIYPEDVLKKQVDLYQQKIQEHRAIGECYTPNAKVLSKNGWKSISDIRENDEILTLNTKTNNIEIQKVSRKIEYDFIGDMINLNSDDISDTVTVNHGYPIYDNANQFKGFYTAEEIYEDKIPNQSHSYIPKQGVWAEDGNEFSIIPAISDASRKMLKEWPNANKDLKVQTSTLMAFSGIYAACGDYDPSTQQVLIYLHSQEIFDGVTELLDNLTLSYTLTINDYDRALLFISDPRIYNFIKIFDENEQRRIPKFVRNESKKNINVFYDWYQACMISHKLICNNVYIAQDICEILLKIGYNGQIIDNHDNTYTVKKCMTKSISLNKRYLTTTHKYYDGKVMCVEVPNHTFYVMDGGKCHWTKNCNHPAESTIDLGRVSHNIIELHWEGRTLVGKMELNVSMGFVNHGICSTLGDTVANLLLNGYKIGVSSRGVGSVEQKLGNYIVGDDFELICWDVVSDPSTNNAFITLDGKEGLQPYLESKNVDASKVSINEKIDKINKILNE